MEEKLLEGEFQMHPKNGDMFFVQLMRQNIIFYKKDPKNSLKGFTSILLKNVIGCKVYESCDKQDPYPCFKVIAMIKKKKGVRIKEDIVFRIVDYCYKEGNVKIAELWMRTILWLLQEPDINTQLLKEKIDCPSPKRYLIVINPKSGQGKSEKIFHEQVEPFLNDANVMHETLITEYAGHCRKMASTFDYKKYDTIVVCSGDGLLHEYFNGVFERHDWKDALNVPVSILPTGSGNALAASVMFFSKEAFEISSAVFILLRGKPHPLDLFSIQNEKEKRFGFLSVTWGISSDIDIESEKFRSLGSARFTLGFMQKLFSLRHYKGKFEYLESNESLCEQGAKAVDSEDGMLKEGNVKSCDINEKNAAADAQTIPKQYGPPSSLVPLNSNVPLNWKVIEDNFIMLNLTSISHLGLDLHSSPGSLFNDGCMSAQFVLLGISKTNILKMFLKIENGDHVSMPDLYTKNIVAFRLTPSPDRIGHIAVDGEEVHYGIIQGEVFPSLGSVIVCYK